MNYLLWSEYSLKKIEVWDVKVTRVQRLANKMTLTFKITLIFYACNIINSKLIYLDHKCEANVKVNPRVMWLYESNGTYVFRNLYENMEEITFSRFSGEIIVWNRTPNLKITYLGSSSVINILCDHIKFERTFKNCINVGDELETMQVYFFHSFKGNDCISYSWFKLIWKDLDSMLTRH